jgi:hypothetical protein
VAESTVRWFVVRKTLLDDLLISSNEQGEDCTVIKCASRQQQSIAPRQIRTQRVTGKKFWLLFHSGGQRVTHQVSSLLCTFAISGIDINHNNYNNLLSSFKSPTNVSVDLVRPSYAVVSVIHFKDLLPFSQKRHSCSNTH